MDSRVPRPMLPFTEALLRGFLPTPGAERVACARCAALPAGEWRELDERDLRPDDLLLVGVPVVLWLSVCPACRGLWRRDLAGGDPLVGGEPLERFSALDAGAVVGLPELAPYLSGRATLVEREGGRLWVLLPGEGGLAAATAPSAPAPVVEPGGPELRTVWPLSEATLRAALPAVTKAREACTVCAAIGGAVVRVTRAGETAAPPPPAVGSLRELLRLGEDIAGEWVEACPECGGLYLAERSYEYLVTGSEDTLAWYRLSVDDLVRRLLPAPPGAQLRGFADGTWAVVNDPAANRRQRR